MIFHITSQDAWAAAQRQGEYTAPSLATEGFIHLSTEAQVLPVAENYYRGQTGLVLLMVDPERLTSELKWEDPSGGAPPPGVPEGQLFPHVYGPLNLEAVVKIAELKTDSHGAFLFPEI